MTPARTLLQTMALGALLAAQMHGAMSMPGVRQALRTIDVPTARLAQPDPMQVAAIGEAGTTWKAFAPCREPALMDAGRRSPGEAPVTIYAVRPCGPGF
jgi:hypothetical protein